jgi:hypothetical protein
MVDFLKEFFVFLRKRKKYFLIPVVFVLILVGTLLFFTSGTAVAPFIYTLSITDERTS